MDGEQEGHAARLVGGLPDIVFSTQTQYSESMSGYARRILANQDGLTMIELLVVIAILAILILLTILGAPRFLIRGHDARRKSDLQALKIAFEQYQTDKGCYPDEFVVNQCGSTSTALSPYLPRIPCDPTSNAPYVYVRLDCNTFWLYTTLANEADPDVTGSGCASGCGLDTNGDGVGENNYGVTSNDVSSEITFTLPDAACGFHCTPNLGGCCSGTYSCSSSGNYCIKN